MGIFVRFKENTRKKIFSAVKENISGNNFTLGKLAERLGVSLPADLAYLRTRKVNGIFFSHLGASENSAVILLTENREQMKNSIIFLAKKAPLAIFLNERIYDSLDKSLIKFDNAPIIPLKNSAEQIQNLLSPYRESYRGKVIGITGSFGKTTTKLLIEKIIKDRYRYRFFSNKANNNSNFSVAENIQSNMRNFYKYFLQEVGAARVNSIKTASMFLKPDYAIVTNIREHHIGSYGSFDRLLEDKMQLVENLADSGTAIVNFDDENLRNYEYHCKLITFGIDADCPLDYRAKNIELSTQEDNEYIGFDIEHSGKLTHITASMTGRHNVYNILASFALADSLGFSEAHTVKSISESVMRGNRQNLIRYGKNTFIVDCYNVANETVISSFNILTDIIPERSGRRIAVVGAENGLGNNRIAKTEELGRELAKFDIDLIVCFGNPLRDETALQRYGDARTLYRTLKNEGRATTKLILNKNKLYKFLSDEIKDDDIVLFKCITYLGATIPIDKAFGTWLCIDTNQVKKKIVLETEGGFTGYKINFMNESLITSCDSRRLRADTLTIPDKFLDQDIFGVDKDAFLGAAMKTLDLGSSIKVISSGAFRSCAKLTSVNFPDSLMHIMEDSFKDCTAIEEIVLGKGIRQIDKNAFAGCASLKRCTVPAASSLRIEKNAFPKNVEIVEK